MKNVESRKFHGIKKAVSDIASCVPNSGQYLEVHYDTAEDKLITNLQCSFGYNSWTEYHDSAVIFIDDYSSPITMKKLKEDIINAIYR